MCQKIKTTGLRFLWVTFLVIFLDRITKYYIQKLFVPYEDLPITSFFNITLAYNKGAAFSFLDTAAGWQVWMFGALAVIVSCVLLVWLYRLSTDQRWLAIALTFIMGGALGNLTDRLLYGHVIDFLDFHWQNLHFPAFNIADSAICVGAFMLMLDVLITRKKS